MNAAMNQSEVITCPHVFLFVTLGSSLPHYSKGGQQAPWEAARLPVMGGVLQSRANAKPLSSSVMPSCPSATLHTCRLCALRHLSSPSDIVRTFTVDPLHRPYLHLTKKVLLQQETLSGLFL